MSFSSYSVSIGSGSSRRRLSISTMSSVLLMSGIFCSSPLRRCAVLASINRYLLHTSAARAATPAHARDRLLEALERRRHILLGTAEMLHHIRLPSASPASTPIHPPQTAPRGSRAGSPAPRASPCPQPAQPTSCVRARRAWATSRVRGAPRGREPSHVTVQFCKDGGVAGGFSPSSSHVDAGS